MDISPLNKKMVSTKRNTLRSCQLFSSKDSLVKDIKSNRPDNKKKKNK